MKDAREDLLVVDKLITSFDTESGFLRAVDQVSFSVPAGSTVGIVGESGCGKSVTAMSIVRLLPQPAGKTIGGHVWFKGEDLLRADDERMQKIRGGEIGVIFQEPMSALNPLHRIGRQVAEVFLLHRDISKEDAWDQSYEMLKLVGIPAPEKRMMEYPHQLSGGMRQRVVIALALACRPSLVIADEPTTALDVTVQAQILDLMARLRAEMNMSMMLITHDLGVIAENCSEVVVMYAGRVVEKGPVSQIFAKPLHAYTRGLLRSMPTLDSKPKSTLPVIPGMVASLGEHVHGCRFCQRMGIPISQLHERPKLVEITPGHWVENCERCYQP